MNKQIWHQLYTLCILLPLLLLTGCSQSDEEEALPIGVIAPISGTLPSVGEASINAAYLATDAINEQGGLLLPDGKKRKVKLLIADNQNNAKLSVEHARKLINRDGVIAIIGPQTSSNTIPTGQVAERAQVLMISPWSSNPQSTLDREFVYRIVWIDSIQGRYLASFTKKHLGINKVAVLFDKASDYNRGLANYYKEAFEKQGGEVVAFESYITGDHDFSEQFRRIQASGAELIFLPNYHHEIPEQVAQAKEIGLQIPFLGSDTWATLPAEQLPLFNGYFFPTHFSPKAEGKAIAQFVKEYQQRYGSIPDDVAALTYDAFQVLFQSIAHTPLPLTSKAIRDSLRSIGSFEGLTGTIRYRDSGDPDKSLQIMQIRDGQVHFYKKN